VFNLEGQIFEGQIFHGPAIKSRDTRLRALSSNNRRTSRGTVVHNLGGAARLRESAGLIELLGDPSEVALTQLVRVAKQRFGTKSITLLRPRKVRERLSKMVAEQGLEIAQERER